MIEAIELLFREHANKQKCMHASMYINREIWEKIIPGIIKLDSKFSSSNHFVRCAINNLIKEEIARLKAQQTTLKTAEEVA